MNKSEFDLVARLLKSKEPVISAVRMIVFDGVANADAARQVGVTPQAVHRSTKRFLALHKEICDAFKKTLA
jgi:hypothetical protein